MAKAKMISFADILRPLTVGDFISSYWDKSALHIPRDSSPKFSELPGQSDLARFFCGPLTADGWSQPTLRGAFSATWIDGKGAARSLSAQVSPELASSLYNIGASLCFRAVDAADPALRSLVDDVMKNCGFEGQAYMTAYVSPPNSGGPLHLDPQHVFFLQVAGEKHWKVSSEPAIFRAPFHATAAELEAPALKEALRFIGWPSAPPAPSTLADIVLKEGDVLYLPPGTWHEPRTMDSLSLHYTLTLAPISSWTVLFSFLRTLMLRRADWRRDLRFLEWSPGGHEEQIVDEMLSALRGELGTVRARDMLRAYRYTETLPPPIHGWFRSH